MKKKWKTPFATYLEIWKRLNVWISETRQAYLPLDWTWVGFGG
ncbi:hypothetical protein Isop_2096 [Isosphaera pallida ATCC 43644]|uniref:Uncharacterized protein n=1 Tax=Isosphaera pallida (strain ATCC 43644 / DSM 9630 / IS1B) TaxID=575540 RepID=E8R475_ISOPI|nr:hypothetical protein Isop_2096 [Isosphaera pallida ATCC 43644]